MQRQELKVFKRDTGKSACKKFRRDGNVPAILYGAGCEPKPLFVNMRELDAVVSTDAGWNILLDLNIDEKERVLSRITEYQSDVLTRKFTHIDFNVLDINKKMKAEIPIRLVGKSKGVAEGGILELITRKIEVKCLPTIIPPHIDIDVSNLDIGENIHIDDVSMPEGVECVRESNYSIATIVAPTVITPEAAEAAPAEGVPVEGAAAPAEGDAAKKEGAEAKPAKAQAKAKGGE